MNEPRTRRIVAETPRACLCAVALAALSAVSPGCAPVDRPDVLASTDRGPAAPEKAPSETRAIDHDPPRCEDQDGDGFGLGECPPDCDDRDPTVTNACVRCLRPATGCACDQGSAPRPCDTSTDSAVPGPDGVCHLGARTCQRGQWSRCEAFRSPFQYVSPTVSCGNSCDPSCRHFVDCHESTDPAPSVSSLTLGAANPAVFCQSGTTPGGFTGTCTTVGSGPYIRGTSPAAWIDACAVSGHATLLAGSDDGAADLSLPFPFAYFGAPVSGASVSANGMIFFAAPSAQWVNQPLPYAAIPDALFAFWDDLTMRTGVCTATVGASPNRRFVVEWRDAGFYSPPSAATHLDFEVVLAESAHTIDLLFNQMDGDTDRPSGSSATVGLQRGVGTSFDRVTYNTANVIHSGTALRWTPASGTTLCSPAVFTRTFTADCADAEASAPVWGRFNYTSTVPPGTAIRFEARGAQDAAGLAAATAVRLPNAPTGIPGVPSSIDLGALLFVAGPTRYLAHSRVVQITAYLDPSADLSLSPTLGSLEQQYSCEPVEIPYSCQQSSACYNGPCRRGRMDCTRRPAACVDDGPRDTGASCGAGRVCDGVGACVPCAQGALCDTGDTCAVGRISCDTGTPVCATASSLPSGAPCAVSPDAYTRAMVSPAWIEACGAPGSDTLLVGSQDGTATAALPFAFRYYGRPFTTVGISANGMLGFTAASNQWVNSALPAAPSDTLFAFWDDLEMRDGVCTATFGVAPHRVFAVEWRNAGFSTISGPVGELTFEVLLEEGTHTLTALYNTLRSDDDRASGASATFGIQRDAGSTYDMVSHNTAGVVRDGSAIRWTPSVTSACNLAGACQACSGSEVCDGADNNCNGVVDETIPSLSCGVGACARTVPGCVRGAVPACTPSAPIAETCNGVDDDCDGAVDEAIPSVVCGVGACQRTVPGCVGGVVPACTPGAPSAEVCDNVDNDCDGAVDDDLARACYTGASGTAGVGVCRSGSQICAAGSWGAACPGEVIPSPEYCNGLDDNCNGAVDEACIGAVTCPSDVTMFAGETRSLAASPRGIVTALQWSIVSGPPGATAVGGVLWSPSVPTGPVVSARPMLVGAYRVRVSGVDALGGARACEFNLTANNRGVRVELTWNGSGDLDLHLHNGNSSSWFNVDDAYYANPRPLWGATLDVHNATSNGPENIRVDTPAAGSTYYVGVNNEARGDNRVATVRVFCGGAGVTPAAVYTSALLRGHSSGNCNNVNTFWRVARVVVRPDGGCDVTPTDEYTMQNDACMRL